MRPELEKAAAEVELLTRKRNRVRDELLDVEADLRSIRDPHIRRNLDRQRRELKNAYIGLAAELLRAQRELSRIQQAGWRP